MDEVLGAQRDVGEHQADVAPVRGPAVRAARAAVDCTWLNAAASSPTSPPEDTSISGSRGICSSASSLSATLVSSVLARLATWVAERVNRCNGSAIDRLTMTLSSATSPSSARADADRRGQERCVSRPEPPRRRRSRWSPCPGQSAAGSPALPRSPARRLTNAAVAAGYRRAALPGQGVRPVVRLRPGRPARRARHARFCLLDEALGENLGLRVESFSRFRPAAGLTAAVINAVPRNALCSFARSSASSSTSAWALSASAPDGSGRAHCDQPERVDQGFGHGVVGPREAVDRDSADNGIVPKFVQRADRVSAALSSSDTEGPAARALARSVGYCSLLLQHGAWVGCW